MIKKSDASRALLYFLVVIVSMGSIVPSGLHLKNMERCDQTLYSANSSQNTMEEKCLKGSMNDHHPETKNNLRYDSCDLVIDWGCNTGKTPIVTEVITIKKVKSLQIPLIGNHVEIHSIKAEKYPSPIYLSNSYSPPPLFLANASFLI